MSETASKIIGEAKAYTNERVLNYALNQIATLLNRRDIGPAQKIDMTYAYLLKVRRELLNEID